jgi:hypothetical protein
MRSLILFCLFFAANVFATPAPFPPFTEDLVNQNIIDVAEGKLLIGNSSGKIGVASIGTSGIVIGNASGVAAGEALGVDGFMQHRMVRATYDVAVDLGTIAAHGLGITIPAGAIITRSWFYTVTQFVDAGAGTVALHCEDANNIYSAADITGNAIGVMITGVQDDAIANFTGSIAADCELTATVATAAQTAGKLILYVEYVQPI